MHPKSKLRNTDLIPFARRLRREMTKEEKHLWYDFLKKLPCTVYRQKVLGCYIADFYIAAAKLVVEVDGGQHQDEKAYRYDLARDRWLREQGLDVMRFSNEEVRLNFRDVCIRILERLPQDVRTDTSVIALIPEGD